ncbi:uncharacterized protein LOC122507234 [Leptopilina heterotoma]|uniref:uncharacterized protein LOC122507234 n=1 Tax=Leptopilina heterotoma TaxID=63436 RepID=UPI001CA84EAC|nr:uncharacterized protein LOC122507234 [Leptopilina heterotoma]
MGSSFVTSNNLFPHRTRLILHNKIEMPPKITTFSLSPVSPPLHEQMGNNLAPLRESYAPDSPPPPLNPTPSTFLLPAPPKEKKLPPFYYHQCHHHSTNKSAII